MSDGCWETGGTATQQPFFIQDRPCGTSSIKPMFIPFSRINPAARLWVYQANRLLTDEEVLTIEAALEPALDTWAAHGSPLLASAQVVESRFVIIAVDEDHSLPSGCSIDASTHFLQAIGRQLGTEFFDRSPAFINADGKLETVPIPGIKTAVLTGKITQETTVFNTLVSTKAEFLSDWTRQAGNTWLKRYFVKQLV